MTAPAYIDAAKADSVPVGRQGPWVIDRYTVTGFDALRGQLTAMRDGRGAVREGTKLTRLVHDRRGIVMSDSPDELRDLYPLVAALHQLEPARVLMHGLGLGCALRMVLACPTVQHVDLVELDPDVAALHGQLDPRVQLHVGDAYTHPWPTGTRWDVAWHDIWDDLTDRNLPGYARLHRRFGRRVRWQGSWGWHWVQRHRDR